MCNHKKTKNKSPQDTFLLKKIHLIHGAEDLKPLVKSFKGLKADPAFKGIHLFIDFLSYQEGVIDGLGRKATSKGSNGLLLLSLLDRKDLKLLSYQWCESVLMGALQSLPAWPHIFKAYTRPMKPLDGRLLIPIALEQYLLHRPMGQKRVKNFLRQKLQGLAISSVIKRHIYDLIGRSSFFGNRPTQKYLECS